MHKKGFKFVNKNSFNATIACNSISLCDVRRQRAIIIAPGW